MLQPGPRGARSRRLRVVVAVLVVACGAWLVLWSPTSAPPARIILIVVDTLRRDRVSVYGGAVPTPNIDSFAEGGSVFPVVFGAFHQTPMSMGALFTGHTPSLEANPPGTTLPWSSHTWCGLARLAANDTDTCVPAGIPTLAERLRRAGYHTAGVTSNLLLFRPAGYDRGFDDWAEIGPSVSAARAVQAGNPVVYEPELQAGDRVNRAVQEWLAQRHGDHFFLYVHYMDVHDWAQRKISYDEGVRTVDARIGELRRMLEAEHLLEGSVVVLTADHGEHLDERHALPALPLHMGNPSFVPTLAVPLVVWPRIPFETRDFLRSDDTFRLILRLAQLDTGPPPDLAPSELLLTERLFVTYQRGGWKSLWPRALAAPYLFDLAADPGELHDVASAHPDRIAEHKQRIDELVHRLAGGATSRTLSPEDQTRLRALGYAE